MDQTQTTFLFRIFTHKKQSHITGKAVAFDKKGADLSSDIKVTLQLKDGRSVSYPMGDLRDATKGERKEFSGRD